MRERTVIHTETTVEVKFDAKVIAKLKDSDYHSEIEDCRFEAWSEDGKIYCLIQAVIKIFDETERNIAILNFIDDEKMELKYNEGRRLYASWCDKISVEDVIAESESAKSRLEEVIEGLIVDVIVESV